MSAEEPTTAPAAAPAAPAAAETPAQGGLDDATLTKYKAAGEIAANAIKKVINLVLTKPEVTVQELCNEGDATVTSLSAAIYNKPKGVQKGSAYPTSVAINGIICNSAPLANDPLAQRALVSGDVVKIQIGAHIDGFPVVAAETVVVPSKPGPDAALDKSPETVGPSRVADALKAAHVAAELAIRLIKPGAMSIDIAKTVDRAVRDEFGLFMVEGMNSCQMEKDVIDGKKKIVFNPEPNNRPENFKLEENEVYGIDLHITTGPDGKSKPDTARTTIYKRIPAASYLLKMATSRRVFSEVSKKFGAFPFHLGALEDQKGARMGIKEAVDHGLLQAFDTLVVASDGSSSAASRTADSAAAASAKAITTQVSFSVVVNSKGAIRLNPEGSWYQEGKTVKSEKVVQNEETKKLLETPVRSTAKTNKKKKKAGEGAAAEATPAAAA
ncbi:unnamed protein product [Tilletia controversa]|uniref:Peptidase M24 domain-containing protein n=3 Tax=Tilletia TaxID=13289 RepID=A0A8X7N0Y3_9BASI|nr:hypothetical protein CF336_g263 [Tilletia laevis]KAE8205533.1 hypothetical protein CF328_g439 [Tilletia controversa]KAE8265490.1 hypothetical protein A4X03_0g231 [Tilletia caries]KAE8208740.1 hypothetical protein CF335_g192 [Tilletia laevis]KAE8256154.1 hypothetical protein A4X06_0g41 [Tilletia controversa]